MQGEHTAEEDFQTATIAGFVKLLIRQESELLPRDTLGRNRQQVYIRAFEETEFTEDKAFTL